MDYNVKDLFSNMIDYCDRIVSKTISDNKTNLNTYTNSVKNEAKIRYANDKTQNDIIVNHIRAVRKKHYFSEKLPAGAVKIITFNISAEGETSKSKVSTKKMNGYTPTSIAGFQFANEWVLPSQVYISAANTDGTGKLTVCINNNNPAQEITVNANVWILWTKSGNKATLNVAK